jgi:hypothetical protein
MSYSAQRRPGQFRPQMESLEDRCLATVTFNPVTGIPGSVKQVISLASSEAKAIKTSITRFQQAAANTDPASLSGGLLRQHIAVGQAELNSVNKLIRTFQHSHLTPTQAYLMLFAKQVAIANTNTSLQTFQLNEIAAGHISAFKFSTKF